MKKEEEEKERRRKRKGKQRGRGREGEGEEEELSWKQRENRVSRKQHSNFNRVHIFRIWGFLPTSRKSFLEEQ